MVMATPGVVYWSKLFRWYNKVSSEFECFFLKPFFKKKPYGVNIFKLNTSSNQTVSDALIAKPQQQTHK